MFSLSAIWKSRLALIVLMGVSTLVYGLFAQPALANGETYTWTDDTNTAITASGGSYPANFTIKQSPITPTTGGAVFIGDVTMPCNGTDTTFEIKLTVDADNYQKIYPSMANLTLTDTKNAACAQLDTQVAISKANGTTTTQTNAANGAAECDQGGFTWLFCPVIDNLAKSISTLVKDALIPMLEVKPISPASTPELYAVWENIRNFTEVLFILVFIILIYATATEQDIAGVNKYAIKRTLPRLVIAALLVQFSFTISSFIVDIGNVLGGGIETFFTSVLNPQVSPPSLVNLLENLVAGGVGVIVGAGAVAALASWTIALPLLISMFMTLFVVFLTLGARYLILSILIAVSPLAMLAWVLPNTEGYFNFWRKLFFSLILMYPIIVGILAIASIVNEILPFTASTASSTAAMIAVAIIKPLIAIAAFLMVPVTFRWASKGLQRFTGMLAGAGIKGQGILKSSDLWKRGQEARKVRQADQMNRFVKSKGITKLGKGGAVKRGIGGTAVFLAGAATMNAPKSARAVQEMRSGIIKATAKQLDDLEEATVPNLQKILKAQYETDPIKRKQAIKELRADAPNLVQIASTPSGRIAVAKRLADMGFTTDVINRSTTAPRRSVNPLSINRNPSDEHADLLKASSKEFGAKPTILARITAPDNNYVVKDAAGRAIGAPRARVAGDLDINTFSGFVRGIKASTFGDKHHVENFKVMGARVDKAEADMTDEEKLQNRVAKEAAETYAREISARVVEEAFKPGKDRSANISAKLEWLKATQVNREEFLKKDNLGNPKIPHEYNDTYMAITKQLEQTTASGGVIYDEELAKNMAILAGLSSYVAEANTAKANADIAKDWYLNGVTV